MRKLRNLGVVAFLVTAALMLTGCWAVVVNGNNGTRNITIPPAISNQIIWQCTVQKGTGQPRAFCALDTIHALCYGDPVKGISKTDCEHISSYGEWQDLEQAIVNVTGPRDDCLSFFYETGNAADDFWGSVFKGIAGCQ